VPVAQTRAQSSTVVPGILWIGLNAKGKQQFMVTGCVSAEGGTNLSEEESIRSAHSEVCFLRATADRKTAVRYAYGALGNGSASVVQVCEPAVVASYGAQAVRPLSRKNESVNLNIAEDGCTAFFAWKDVEKLMLVQKLSTADGHNFAMR